MTDTNTVFTNGVKCVRLTLDVPISIYSYIGRFHDLRFWNGDSLTSRTPCNKEKEVIQDILACLLVRFVPYRDENDPPYWEESDTLTGDEKYPEHESGICEQWYRAIEDANKVIMDGYVEGEEDCDCSNCDARCAYRKFPKGQRTKR